MNTPEFRNGLKSAYVFFVNAGLVRSVATLSSFSPSEEFKKACFSPRTSYRNLFFQGLSGSEFNFQLDDYSFFQFSYFGRDHLRYAFYPSPLTDEGLGDLAALESEVRDGLKTYEEFSIASSSIETEPRRPLVRYEYCEEQYVENLHATSHFHIGLHSENRWPVERLVHPLHFSLLIAKLYFERLWHSQVLTKDDAGEDIGAFDFALAKAKAGSKIVNDQYFKSRERRLPYFA